MTVRAVLSWSVVCAALLSMLAGFVGSGPAALVGSVVAAGGVFAWWALGPLLRAPPRARR